MRARTTRQKIPGVPRWCGHYRTHSTGTGRVTATTHTGPIRLWVWRAWWDLIQYLDRWSDPHQLWADPPFDGLDDDEGGGRDAMRLRR